MFRSLLCVIYKVQWVNKIQKQNCQNIPLNKSEIKIRNSILEAFKTNSETK